MLVHKADLLPHVDFDVERCVAHARRVNPDIEALVLSARTGQGMPAWLDWLDWLERQARPAPHSRPHAPHPAGPPRASAAP
jgi:hydrogenase nickel incorporation protein HypB